MNSSSTLVDWAPTDCENAKYAFLGCVSELTDYTEVDFQLQLKEKWRYLKKAEEDALSEEERAEYEEAKRLITKLTESLKEAVSKFINENNLSDFDDYSGKAARIDSSKDIKEDALKVFHAAVTHRIKIVNQYIKVLWAIIAEKGLIELQDSIARYRPRWDKRSGVFSIRAIGYGIPFPKPLIQRLQRLRTTDHDLIVVIEWDEGESAVLTEKIESLVTHLSNTYGIKVEVLKTNRDFNKVETLQRGEKEGVYFISEESPDITAAQTEYYLKRRAARHDILMELAHEKQSEQSVEKAKQVSTVISDIIRTYREANNGTDPNLSAIAARLTQQGIETPRGGSTWRAEQVKRIIEHKGLNR